MVSWREGAICPQFLGPLCAAHEQQVQAGLIYYDTWVAGIDCSVGLLHNSGNKRNNILELCTEQDPTQFNELTIEQDPDKHTNEK